MAPHRLRALLGPWAGSIAAHGLLIVAAFAIRPALRAPRVSFLPAAGEVVAIECVAEEEAPAPEPDPRPPAPLEEILAEPADEPPPPPDESEFPATEEFEEPRAVDPPEREPRDETPRAFVRLARPLPRRRAPAANSDAPPSPRVLAAPLPAPAPPAPPSPAASRDRPVASGATREPSKIGRRCRPPAYPEEARARGLEGCVLLLVAIDAEGRVNSVRVLESSGHALLDDAAVAAVRRWRFEPARRGDEAVASEATLPIRFALES